ncbi:MAG TPA: hypothetical protein VE464_03695 [Streptosporangiaceae bacterium]|nr:hypothetical protein [Streptosporangiaceae bacterium]
MKTRDRVATALAPHEAEAIIEQARRRQRRRRRMIGLELAAVIVVWLVVMSVASGGIWDPFAAQGGARSAGAHAAARPPLSGQAQVTWRASLEGVLQAYGGGGITFSGKNWSEDLATTVPAEGGLQSGDAVTNRIVDGQGYFTANVHGRWVWVHDPHPDLPDLIFTELPDPRTLLRRLAPAARFRAAGDRMRGGVRLSVLRATDPGRVRGFRFLPGVHSGGLVVSLEVWADRHQVVHRMAITFRSTERVDTGKPVSKAATRELRRAESAWRKLFHRYLRTGKRGPASVWNAARDRVVAAQQNAVQIRREIAVTEVTLTYSGIGQPQHIAVPRHTIPVSQLG